MTKQKNKKSSQETKFSISDLMKIIIEIKIWQLIIVLIIGIILGVFLK